MNHIDESDNICKELSMLLPSPPISDKELGELIHLNLNQIYIFLYMFPSLMSNFIFIIDKQLTTTDLIDLLHLLYPIKYEWPVIGEQLQVDYNEIRSEEHNVAHDDLARLHDVLKCWINTTKFDKSWRTVITVIEKPPIQEKDIVEKIYEFLKAKTFPSDHEGKNNCCVS